MITREDAIDISKLSQKQTLTFEQASSLIVRYIYDMREIDIVGINKPDNDIRVHLFNIAVNASINYYLTLDNK